MNMVPPSAMDVWLGLLREHGPVVPASTLAPLECAAAASRGRVFWVDTVSDGFGSGDVRFRIAGVREDLARVVKPLESHECFVFQDKSFRLEPWLGALSGNPWERATEVPGLHPRTYYNWTLAGGRLERTRCADAIIYGTDFRDADLVGVVFDRAYLGSLRAHASRWSRCAAQGMTSIAADLTRATLSDCDLTGASLVHSTLSGAAFARCLMDGANLIDGRWAGANLTDCALRGARLSRSGTFDDDVSGVFEDVVFTRCDLRGASFDKALLSRVVFDHCMLGGVTAPYEAIDVEVRAADLSPTADGSQVVTGPSAVLGWPGPAPLPPVRRRSAQRTAWEAEEARRRRGGDPSCSEAEFFELARDGGERVREAVALNPAAPGAVLALLAKDACWRVREAVAENQGAPRPVLEGLLRDEDDGVRWALAGNASAPEPVLERLSRDAHWRVRERVAANLATPASVLHELSRDTEELVQSAVAASIALAEAPGQSGGAPVWGSGPVDPRTSRPLLGRLARRPEVREREAVASNPSATYPMLEALSRDPSDRVRRGVAKNPAAPTSLLAALARDPSTQVRMEVGMNENTPLAVIEALGSDPEKRVRGCAESNQRAPFRMRSSMARPWDD